MAREDGPRAVLVAFRSQAVVEEPGLHIARVPLRQHVVLHDAEAGAREEGCHFLLRLLEILRVLESVGWSHCSVGWSKCLLCGHSAARQLLLNIPIFTRF